MTRAEQVAAVVLAALALAALVLPPETVDLLIIGQVLLLGIAALIAGAYIWQRTRGVTRRVSEYLWLLVRRDKRVTLAIVALALFALALVVPRTLGWEPIVSRPWGTLWLLACFDLLAVGLFDDAIQMHVDENSQA